MSLESATYVADLQPVNPPATDPRSQGDDHLRLIKQVLQNTFGGASRQFQIPGAVSISSNTSVTKLNGESTLYVSTASSAITLTLPALTAADAGWKVRVCKTSSDVNPVFVAPVAGTINSGGVAGVARARRCIPGVITEAIWDGSNWFMTRALALPIGSCIEYHGSSLPAGYEWPNGQTLSSAANYPEYNLTTGGLTTRDKRGLTSICLDNLGGVAAGRLPSGYINANALGATGGVDGVTLSTGQIPAHQHNVYVQVNDPGHTHTLPVAPGGVAGGTGASNGMFSGTWTTSVAYTGITVYIGSAPGSNSQNTAAAGGGGMHSNLQPSMMVSQILVVE